MRLTLTVIAATVALVACGGGGGGEDGPANPATPTTPTNPGSGGQAVITQDNYVAVAREALSTSAFLVDASSFVLGADISNADVLMRFAQQQLLKLPQRGARNPATAIGVSQSFTEPCDTGGSVTVTDTDLNGNGNVDPGDSVTVRPNNCGFGGQVLNGELSLTLSSVSGIPGEDIYPWSVTGTFRFNNLRSQVGNNQSTASGDMTLTASARSRFSQEVSLSTPRFAVTSSYNGAVTNQTLSDYSTTVKTEASGAGLAGISSAQGTLTTSAFGSLNVQTPTPFTRVGSQLYPSSGQAVVTGAGGSKVRVTANSATSVTVSLDANGDGTYETSVNKPWSELR